MTSKNDVREEYIKRLHLNGSDCRSLGEIYFDILKNDADPNKIALIDKFTKKQLNYGELLDESLRVAEELKTLGIGKGDLVGIVSGNRPEFFVPVLSCFFIGATIHPTNGVYLLSELKDTFSISKPKIIFTTEENLKKVQQLQADTDYIKNIINFDGNYLSIIRERSGLKRDEIVENSDHDSAVILSSSGTTGLPKGVVLTQNNIKCSFNYLKYPYIDLNPDNVLIGMMPYFHVFGFLLGIGNIRNLSLTVTLQKFQPNHYCEIIEEYNVTSLQIVPTIAVFLVNHPIVKNYDFSSVKDILCGGAPLGAETQIFLKQRFNCKIRQMYGMTETSGVICLMPIWKESKIGGVGKPFPWVDIKIIDIDTNEEMASGGNGEVCAKTIQNTNGYLNMEEETTSMYLEDGYLRTGDIGYLDENGELFIVDRLKELIKYKGFQVPPAELENILNSHECIVDSGVIGIPDRRAGELPMAFVVKKDNADITEEIIKEFVAGHVSAHKQLHGGVKFINEIPKGPTGKILRKNLRELAMTH
ncbi:PREDICTED: 4-coumarate--CoA ligase 1-like [Nicrophorus vespilloides]|uniref:4-coumarate--CoA ligase 1-like n=1 Tax=Nicrophorus vespilloides TaxID=110193 RepID=A0ABM1N858_NICVS|nr:PREDICTED: 4-coumarate--CoA ligase 1-like [Nicrophorus vespilloides]